MCVSLPYTSRLALVPCALRAEGERAREQCLFNPTRTQTKKKVAVANEAFGHLENQEEQSLQLALASLITIK